MSSFIVLLRAPEQAQPRLVEELVGQNFTDLFQNLEDQFYEDMDCAWMQSHWTSQAHNILIDEHGEVRRFGDEGEWWDVVANTTQRINELADDSERFMDTLIELNNDHLIKIAENYIVQSAEVIRRFKGMWVLRIKGELYG